MWVYLRTHRHVPHARNVTVAPSHWQVVTERAVAVIGNLSTSSEYFSTLREAGALQRLVRPVCMLFRHQSATCCVGNV